MVKCKNCGKGRPRLFNKDGGFCNQACYDEFKAKVEKSSTVRYIQMHRQGSERTVAVDTEGFIEFLADVIKNGWQFADIMNVNRYYVQDDVSERRLDFIEMGELWDIAERRLGKIRA